MENEELIAALRDLRNEVAALRQDHDHNNRQLEAMFSIITVLQPRVPLPPLRGWRVSSDFATTIMELIQENRPDTVVMLGGGTATLIVAYSLERWNPGSGKLVALEQEETYVNLMNQDLQRHSFSTNRARVLHAPLVKTSGDGDQTLWYDTRVLKAVPKIDLLIVDGPNTINDEPALARFPALDMLKDHLNADALVLLDDSFREDEQITLGRWLIEKPVELVAYYETLEGATLMKWTDA